MWVEDQFNVKESITDSDLVNTYHGRAQAYIPNIDHEAST